MLISLLYRLDISEKKFETVLGQGGNVSVADRLAEIIIKRQLEKIKSRNAPIKSDNIPDDERW